MAIQVEPQIATHRTNKERLDRAMAPGGRRGLRNQIASPAEARDCTIQASRASRANPLAQRAHIKRAPGARHLLPFDDHALPRAGIGAMRRRHQWCRNYSITRMSKKSAMA